MSQAQVIAFPGRHADEPIARRLVSLRELQHLLGGSTRWWRYRIAEDMPTHRYCASLRFDPSEVEAWLRERGHGVQA